MKLSVIIPVYNSELYLEKCLDSVLTQDYNNLEVIIVNDGSTDSSEKIIKNFINKYSNIVYIKQSNKGQACSRNIALKKATGELITFVDSDDYIMPSMYSKMINKMQEEETDMAICDMYLEKDNKRIVESGTNFEYLYECPVSLCNKIFKLNLISNLKFKEGIWYEDYNFFIKVTLKKPTYSLYNEPLYVYVIHNNSTMRNNNTLKNLDIITATEDFLTSSFDKNMKDNLIIEHILIGAINRVYDQKSNDCKLVVKELNAYVRKNIDNIFITEKYKKSYRNKKLIILLNYYGMGGLSHILLKVKHKGEQFVW